MAPARAERARRVRAIVDCIFVVVGEKEAIKKRGTLKDFVC